MEIGLLGFSSAIALASIDVVYVVRHTISPIYLADAAVEAVFILGWMAVAFGATRVSR